MEQKFTEFGKKDCTLAFQNVYLNEVEKEELNRKKLSFPRKIYWQGKQDYFGRDIDFWTADRENRYYVLDYGCDWQFPEKKGYILVWKEFKEDALISAIFRKNVRFNAEDRTEVEWMLESIDIPLPLTRKREEILRVLKEALFAYGPTGDPDFNYTPDWDETIVMFNF